MPKADANPTPSRRRLLGHLACAATMAAIAAPFAARAEPADAALIRICARFDELERLIRAANAYETEEAFDSVTGPLYREQELLLDAMCDAQAVTLGGMVAKARTMALWTSDILDRESVCWDDRMSASLIRDLTEVSA